ncbi:SDR family NAD(P)-dependent oxidoreductase [Nonomuraea sp. SYSU D8015]|uniref:SDR family NAD(P)-dependent oxidoreductase n=1 Tax=Nonomuraea sp. SYSU D8015 TaxID=2593644 RepID=UPI001660DC7C|nr:SDR family oxidoreductase [Nonomuraea sp. SYSU D8015]
MLLENKVTVVYGAGGSIGGAVARAFAREGAQVFLAGRTAAPLDKVAADIRATGGSADTAQVDALDEDAVNAFADAVAARAGGIDVSFNAIGVQDVQKPLMEITAEEFARPVQTATRTQFLTTRAAVKHMIPRGGGVILMFGGSGPQTMPGLGGLKVALDAMEGIRRQWACEAGRHGVRVVTMVTGGVPESMPDDHPAKEQIEASLLETTLLGRTATLADVGDVAAFVASDRARTMTSATVNISCGAIVDY